jgi:predicted  nucleic acid-binding Zn-ribbon protein
VKVEKITSEVDEFQNNIKDHKNNIEEAKVLIDKYSDKLKNVRNNREYNSKRGRISKIGN